MLSQSEKEKIKSSLKKSSKKLSKTRLEEIKKIVKDFILFNKISRSKYEKEN